MNDSLSLSALQEVAVARDDVVIDPTKNVLQLVAAAVTRLDDLRAADARRLEELALLRSSMESKLMEAELKRIDANRSSDIAALALASEQSRRQASVLADQLSRIADSLRDQIIASSAKTSQAMEEIANRLSSRVTMLEKNQYEGQGRGQVEDPRIETLFDDVKGLRASRATDFGKGRGMSQLWGYILGAIGLIATILSVIVMSRTGLNVK